MKDYLTRTTVQLDGWVSSPVIENIDNADFKGYEITAEYRLSGSAHIMGPRAVAILDAIAEEHE